MCALANVYSLDGFGEPRLVPDPEQPHSAICQSKQYDSQLPVELLRYWVRSPCRRQRKTAQVRVIFINVRRQTSVKYLTVGIWT